MNIKFSTKLKTTATIILILLMASVTLLVMSAQLVQAQYTNMQASGALRLPAGVTPNSTLNTIAYLSVTPNPVGVGQPLLFNMWIIPPIHNSRYLTDYTVTITKPDGTKDSVSTDSYPGDATAWSQYVPDQVGTWTFKFDMPGQYFPAGNYTRVRTGQANATTSFPTSVYYKPSSSPEQTITVQEEIVYSWPQAPLPTDYWTRPISPDLREWWPILGNFPGTGYDGTKDPEWDTRYPNTSPIGNDNYEFTPWVQGPNTAHIVWRRQSDITGIIGGGMGQISLSAEDLDVSYPDMIYAGRAYETLTKMVNGVPTTVWQCYDIRTGEVYWERTGVTQIPTMITYVERESEAVAGETAMMRGLRVDLLYVGGGRHIRYNPWNGAVTFNVSISPLTTGTCYRDPFFVTVQSLGGGNYRLINWTVGRDPETGVRALEVLNNISWPISSLGAVDYNAMICCSTSTVSDAGAGVTIGTRLVGVSLTSGRVLWNVTTDFGGYDTMSNGVADHGKYAARMKTGEIWCWDLNTGKIAWKSELTSDPWGMWQSYHVQSAYGFYYSSSYDGVHAIDWETGKVAWTFIAPTPYAFETPYQYNGTEVYAFHGGAHVADGKYYCASTEHSPSNPLTRGEKLYCLNATTGEHIWNYTASPVGESRSFVGSVADGYLAFGSQYDGYTYVFGKGKSATTVQAPLTAISQGQSVVITGTVTDQSPAQLGAACVSKDSMTTYMEYLHMQNPIPSGYVVTGVPVSIDAVDPNGNYVHIADVTSDVSGTYSYMWTPDLAGKYTVTATFMGDDSYGSSWAETAVGVTQAPQATATPTSAPKSVTEQYFVPSVAGIIAAIAIVGVLLGILMLRRKPYKIAP